MAYTTLQGRRDLLDSLGEATDRIGFSLTSLGEAYEQLDEHTGENLEAQLFRPVQLAYGRAKRTHKQFAERHKLATRDFQSPPPGAPSHGVKGFIADAVEAAGEADQQIADLQDSMLPIEVGDSELRAGLSEVRELLGHIPTRSRELLRTLGR